MKIMKIVFMGIAILIVVLSLVLGIGVYFASRYLDPQQIKPHIQESLKQVLGREVKIKDLEMMFSIRQGLRVEVKDFQIRDVPEFSQKPIFSVSMMRASLQLLPLLQKQQILVSEIVFENPRINIVRDAQGNFNVLAFDFLKQPQNQPISLNPDQGTAKIEVAGGAVGMLSGLLIRDVHLKNGSIYFEDQTGEIGPSAFLSGIDFFVQNVSMVQPFAFSLKAAVLSQEQNFSLDGRAQIDLTHLLAYVRDLNVRWDLSRVTADRIHGLSSAMAILDIRDPIKGIIFGEIRVAQIGPEGVSELIADIHLEDISFYSGRLRVPVEKGTGVLRLDHNRAELTKARLALGNGVIALTGFIKDYMNQQEYDLSLTIENIDMAQVLDQSGQEVELQGLVSAQASLKGEEMMSLAMFQPEAAKGQVSLADGQLTNINVLNLILQRIEGIPGLVEQLLMHLPQRYQDHLHQTHTPLSSVVASSFIEHERIHIDELFVKSEGFALQGQGTIDFSLKGQVQAQIIIDKDLSEAMVKSVSQLELLADNSGRLVFPVHVSGRFPDQLSFSPDVQNIGRRLLETRGRQELQKLLERALGQDQKDSESLEGDEDDLLKEGESQKIPAEQILDNFFGIIFR